MPDRTPAPDSPRPVSAWLAEHRRHVQWTATTVLVTTVAATAFATAPWWVTIAVAVAAGGTASEAGRRTTRLGAAYRDGTAAACALTDRAAASPERVTPLIWLCRGVVALAATVATLLVINAGALIALWVLWFVTGADSKAAFLSAAGVVVVGRTALAGCIAVARARSLAVVVLDVDTIRSQGK